MAAQKAIEAYGKFQNPEFTADDVIASHVEDFQILVDSLENMEVAINVRSRALIVVSTYGSKFEPPVLKKALAAVVKVIAGPDDTTVLLVSAIQALSGLCKTAPAKLSDFMTREGTDIFMQIILDEEGFNAQVRQAAMTALSGLIDCCFKGVVTKLLHWLSDDREKDEEEQLNKERNYAMKLLTELSSNVKYAASWTEEVQNHLLSLLTLVFATTTASEYSQLVTITANLPLVKAGGGLPLIETLLCKTKMDSQRAFESVCMIAPFVARATACASLTEKFTSLVPTVDSTEQGTWLAKALVLATRCGTVEQAEAMLGDIVTVVDTFLSKMIAEENAELPEDLQCLEAMLLCLSAAGHKKGQLLLLKLNEEAFNSTLIKAQQVIVSMQATATFAIKKKMLNSAASEEDALFLTCLGNLANLLGPLATKHLPSSSIVASWEKTIPLVTVKRSRGGDAATAATKKEATDAPANKKQRQVYQPKVAREKGQQQKGSNGNQQRQNKPKGNQQRKRR